MAALRDCDILPPIMDLPPDIDAILQLLRYDLVFIGERLEKIHEAFSDYNKTAIAAEERKREQAQHSTTVLAERSADQKRQRDTLKIIAVATSVSAAATCLAFAAAVIYAGIAAVQLKEIGKATGVAITAAEVRASKFADAASKALDAAIKQNQLDQRAWVTADGITSNFQLSKPLTIDVLIKNTGKTPAMHLSGYVNFDVVVRGKRPRFSVTQPPEARAILAPNSTSHIKLNPAPDKVIQQIDVDRVQSTIATIYAFGTLSYDDVFSRPHWTNFCFLLTSDAKDWASCSEHNETDDK